MDRNTPTRVLLVEDNPGDARLLREILSDQTAQAIEFDRPGVSDAIDLHHAADGVDAMEFLQREGSFADAPRPDLILLDLNLPRMDGREVLARIKEDEDLRTIPTVILTTSDAEADILRSYQLQANAYLNKPVQLGDFESLVKSITDFWLLKVQLPQQR